MKSLKASLAQIRGRPRLVGLVMLAILGMYVAVVSLLLIAPSSHGSGGLAKTRVGTTPPVSGTNQNWATGHLEARWTQGDCKFTVSFAVSSDPDGSHTAGTITMAAAPGPMCSGELTARLTCLVVTGHHALINGPVIRATGIFGIAIGVMGTLDDNPPSADFGMSGPTYCPPPYAPGNGPPVLEGGIRVHHAG